jgi:hypothetical protein
MAERIIKAFYRHNPLVKIALGKFTLWQPSDFQPIEATGGTVTTFTDGSNTTWQVHTLLSSDSLFVSSIGTTGKIEYCFVAAGGGAYSGAGTKGGCGGGGGGDVIHNIGNPLLISSGIYPLIVGVGGTNASGQTQPRGGDSSGFGVTALGGGRGCQRIEEGDRDGGNGAGGATNYDGIYPSNTTAAPPGVSLSSGYTGGQASTVAPDGWVTGGGAGASETPTAPGYGGDGLILNFDGTSRHYGGGGAGQNKAGDIFPGGLGGGGDSRQDGEDGLGGGGGAFAPGTGPGGRGGNGRIMIRFPLLNPPSYWL